MKKVQLSVADGKIKINHPDLADGYYADPGDPSTCSRRWAARRTPSRTPTPEVPMAQAAAALSETEAQGKSIPAVEVFRARVEQALDDAVRGGKILPRRRDDWRRIALADFRPLPG